MERSAQQCIGIRIGRYRRGDDFHEEIIQGIKHVLQYMFSRYGSHRIRKHWRQEQFVV